MLSLFTQEALLDFLYYAIQENFHFVISLKMLPVVILLNKLANFSVIQFWNVVLYFYFLLFSI